MLLFLLPAIFQAIHAFENHTHMVCISKIENHTHEKTLDCKLDVLKKTDGLFIENIQNQIIVEKQFSIIISPYNFLLHHQPLSYQLRGPPRLV